MGFALQAMGQAVLGVDASVTAGIPTPPSERAVADMAILQGCVGLHQPSGVLAFIKHYSRLRALLKVPLL